MKKYFSDIINIVASEKTDCIAEACSLLTPETLMHYPKCLYKYRTFDDKGLNIDALENDYLWANYPAKYDDPVDAAVKLKLKTELKNIETWVYSHVGEILFYNIPPKGMKSQKCGQKLEKYIEAQTHFVGSSGKIDATAVCRSLFTEANKLPQKQKQGFLDYLKKLETHEFEEKVESEIKNTLDKVVNAFRDNRLIVCLSERNDNQKMWEDYSGKYTGFVIEYKRPDFCSLDDDTKQLLVSIFPVGYYKRLPGVELLPFIEFAFFKDLYGRETDISSANVKLFRQMLNKRIDYISEEEWRIICNSEQQKIVFPFESAVYAGYKTEDKDLAKLKDICQKKGLPLYKQEVRITGQMGFQTVLEGKHNA